MEYFDNDPDAPWNEPDLKKYMYPIAQREADELDDHFIDFVDDHYKEQTFDKDFDQILEFCKEVAKDEGAISDYIDCEYERFSEMI